MKIPPRGRRRGLIAGVLVVLFTIVGFFVLPPIVKAQLEKRLSAELGRTVTVEKVRVNPYTLALTLENFDIRLKDGTGSFLSWKRLYVNFDALASLTGTWTLGAIELDGMHLSVVVMPDGSLNFSDLLARLQPPPDQAAAKPEAPGRPIRIGSLKVTSARLDFSDHSRRQPFATVVGPASFTVTDFRTVSEKGAPYSFTAVTEAGEKLAWTGTLQAQPLSSAGELRLENIVLAKYAPYYAEQFQAELTEGLLFLRGRYELNLTKDARVMKLLDGALQLRGVKVQESATHELAVELPAFDLAGVQADALKQKVSADTIMFTGGHLHMRREADGSINLLNMLKPPVPAASAPAPAATTPTAATAATPVAKPDVMIGEMGLKDFKIDVTDLAAPRPAQLALSDLQLTLKNVTLADGATMPLQMSLSWAPQGTVSVDGTVAVFPQVKADLMTNVTAFALLPLSPYLEQFANVRITQGTVTSALTVQAALPAGQAPTASVTGEIKVEQFGLVDGVHNEELAGFGSFALNGLKVDVAEQIALSLDEVVIAGPYARVVVNGDRTLNLAGIAKSAPAPVTPEPAAPAVAAPAGPASRITIGKVVISDGDYRFTDRSITPAVQMAINQFGGTIAGLSSESLAKADVDLKATVDGSGPVAITGQLDPLGAHPTVELMVDFKNVDLQPLSPYSGKYAGFELARGKLAVDVKLLVDGKKIDSANVVTLNQFTFGAATNSPDATGLPVRLGVALLKDMNGNIVIDLPVQGSTDDPNFRIGRVVMRVIVNLLTKAAVSPFALLGSMFGGGGDELGFQEFVVGTAILQPTEIAKLETMVKALTNRPGLSLDIEGSYDAAADAYLARDYGAVMVMVDFPSRRWPRPRM